MTRRLPGLGFGWMLCACSATAGSSPPVGAKPDAGRPATADLPATAGRPSSDDVVDGATWLCDGSDAVRLRLSVGYGGEWGPSSSELFFTYGIGARFAFVDGKCRYAAGGGELDGIRTGVLDPTVARMLVSELGVDRLGEWARTLVAEPGSCPGYGGPSIVGPDGALQCFCAQCTCCGMQPPREVLDATLAQERWLERLTREGELLSTPVRAAAFLEPTTSGQPDWVFVAWPLSWPASELIVQEGAELTDATTRLVEDADEVAALRALRSQARALAPIAPGILVRESDTVWVRVLLRDELPEGLLEAVGDFEAAHVQPELSRP